MKMFRYNTGPHKSNDIILRLCMVFISQNISNRVCKLHKQSLTVAQLKWKTLRFW